MKYSSCPFPLFLTEAKGQFYRRIEITVRFKKIPTARHITKLKKLIPGYFQEEPLFVGRMLNIGAGKILSRMHRDDIKEMRKTKHWATYSFYLKGFKDIKTFENQLIDRLEEMDEICPIQFVLRDESDMGQYHYQGGNWTHVSDSIIAWHTESVDAFEDFLKELDEDSSTYRQKGDERRLFAYCVKALDKGIALRYNFVDLEKYPKLIDFVMDQLWLERFFKKRDLKGLMKVIQQNASGKYVDVLLYEDLGSLFSTHCFQKDITPKKTQWMLDLARELYSIQDAWELCFPFGSSMAPLARLAVLNNDQDLLKKIVNYTQNDFRGENFINYLGKEALILIQEKKFKEATELFEIALNIKLKEKPVYLDLSVFCNALWVCLKGNTGLPPDRKRNEFFMKKCLPHASKNPAIYYNVSIIYAEMGELEKAYDYFLLTKKHDPQNYELMVDEIKTLGSLKEFKKFLEAEKKIGLQ